MIAKNIKLIIFAILVLLGVSYHFAYDFKYVFADDEEEESEDDEDDEDDEDENEEVKTTIVIPATTVTKTVLKNVEFPDTDRDGLPDSEDPHPTIAEIYIVKDENFDGIDDQYEILNQQ